MDGGGRNWADLPRDLVVTIAESIEIYKDFICFGVVCKPWRSVTTLNNFKGRDFTWWLMEAPDGPNTDARSFTPTSTPPAVAVQHPVPEANGRRCFETLGWLVTVDLKGEMNLLNPFSRTQISLPRVPTFDKYGSNRKDLVSFKVRYTGFIERAVLSSSPSRTDDYVVMIILFGAPLAFWRPGDPTWSYMRPINTTESYYTEYHDIVCYKYQFYAIDIHGRLLLCDIRGPDPDRLKLVGWVPNSDGFLRSYLVQCDENLLIVKREWREEFKVYAIENFLSLAAAAASSSYWLSPKNGGLTLSLVEKKSLGNATLFLGHSASTSVDASRLHGVKSNCIYHTWDYEYLLISSIWRGEKEMGIYHMEDGTWEVISRKDPRHLVCQPIWVSPNP